MFFIIKCFVTTGWQTPPVSRAWRLVLAGLHRPCELPASSLVHSRGLSITGPGARLRISCCQCVENIRFPGGDPAFESQPCGKQDMGLVLALRP